VSLSESVRGYIRLNCQRYEIILWKCPLVPKVAITKEVYEKIEAQAYKEGVSVSKLVERLLQESTTKKIIESCPRCAFRF